MRAAARDRRSLGLGRRCGVGFIEGVEDRRPLDGRRVRRGGEQRLFFARYGTPKTLGWRRRRGHPSFGQYGPTCSFWAADLYWGIFVRPFSSRILLLLVSEFFFFESNHIISTN
jgi:hypothetical protein